MSWIARDTLEPHLLRFAAAPRYEAWRADLDAQALTHLYLVWVDLQLGRAGRVRTKLGPLRLRRAVRQSAAWGRA